jgi:hypothetical protein
MLIAGETYCESIPSGYLEGHVIDESTNDPLEGVNILAEKWESDGGDNVTNSTVITMTCKRAYTVLEYPLYTSVITTGSSTNDAVTV